MLEASIKRASSIGAKPSLCFPYLQFFVNSPKHPSSNPLNPNPSTVKTSSAHQPPKPPPPIFKPQLHLMAPDSSQPSTHNNQIQNPLPRAQPSNTPFNINTLNFTNPDDADMS
jgi:hypothetical protein